MLLLLPGITTSTCDGIAVSAPPISCNPRLFPGLHDMLISRNNGRGWTLGEGVDATEIGDGDEKER